jgi:hypothetical protein
MNPRNYPDQSSSCWPSTFPNSRGDIGDRHGQFLQSNRLIGCMPPALEFDVGVKEYSGFRSK